MATLILEGEEERRATWQDFLSLGRGRGTFTEAATAAFRKAVAKLVPKWGRLKGSEAFGKTFTSRVKVADVAEQLRNAGFTVSEWVQKIRGAGVTGYLIKYGTSFHEYRPQIWARELRVMHDLVVDDGVVRVRTWCDDLDKLIGDATSLPRKANASNRWMEDWPLRRQRMFPFKHAVAEEERLDPALVELWEERGIGTYFVTTEEYRRFREMFDLSPEVTIPALSRDGGIERSEVSFSARASAEVRAALQRLVPQLGSLKATDGLRTVTSHVDVDAVSDRLVQARFRVTKRPLDGDYFLSYGDPAARQQSGGGLFIDRIQVEHSPVIERGGSTLRVQTECPALDRDVWFATEDRRTDDSSQWWETHREQIFPLEGAQAVEVKLGSPLTYICTDEGSSFYLVEDEFEQFQRHFGLQIRM